MTFVQSQLLTPTSQEHRIEDHLPWATAEHRRPSTGLPRLNSCPHPLLQRPLLPMALVLAEASATAPAGPSLVQVARRTTTISPTQSGQASSSLSHASDNHPRSSQPSQTPRKRTPTAAVLARTAVATNRRNQVTAVQRRPRRPFAITRRRLRPATRAVAWRARVLAQAQAQAQEASLAHCDVRIVGRRRRLFGDETRRATTFAMRVVSSGEAKGEARAVVRGPRSDWRGSLCARHCA